MQRDDLFPAQDGITANMKTTAQHRSWENEGISTFSVMVHDLAVIQRNAGFRMSCHVGWIEHGVLGRTGSLESGKASQLRRAS